MAEKENYRNCLADILSDGKTRYYIPTLQRNYEWEALHVDELWSDLFDDEFWADPEDAPAHFLGTLVMCPRVEDDDEDSLEVLDGQQRLTTLSLLLAECSFLMVKHRKDGCDYDHGGHCSRGIKIKQ